jgi:alkylation response protein AidB-like acyl-CoA dehydrogenase
VSADPVTAARALAPLAAEHAAEGERARRLDEPVVRALAEAGLFRLCVPATAGGLEAPPAALAGAAEELARGDAAAGWCVAIGATSGLLLGYLPLDSAREVQATPTTVLGGVFAPRGRAIPADGGHRVTGRWPFASGCEHCDWLMGGAIVEGDPAPRLMLARADEVVIHDTWHVAGLRGTGSHDIEMTDVLVPAGRSASVFTDTPTADGPLYAFPLFGLLALAIAGVALGTARGALDDLVALAGAKTPTGSRRVLAERPPVQAATAQAEASLRAARALLYEAIDAAWEIARASGEVPVTERTALRLAATHAATTGADVAATAFRLGGGSAIYERTSLERRFRDAHVIPQHMLVAPATLELTGRLVLGLPTDTTQL